MQEARQLVSNVDWPCDTKYLFSEKNLGCRTSVVQGISRVFEMVDRAIILEDGLPSRSFIFPILRRVTVSI